MSCEKYIPLLEKYLNGDLDDESLGQLKRHARDCASCGRQLAQIDRLGSMMKDALSPKIPAEKISEAVLAKLQSQRPVLAPPAWPGRRVAAAAAGILLTAGLLLGFVLGRLGAGGQIPGPETAKVPMRVARLEGTVLVKHHNSDVWHAMLPDADIHLGDTFHSVSSSAFVLALDDGQSSLELDQNSMLVLKSYNGGTRFHLQQGSLTADLESPHPPFFISTPHGRVEALGTEFTVTVK